jgi:hypothetical protein
MRWRNGKADVRPVLVGPVEEAGLKEAGADTEHQLDPQPDAAPLINLVEVEPVRDGSSASSSDQSLVGLHRLRRPQRTPAFQP